MSQSVDDLRPEDADRGEPAAYHPPSAWTQQFRVLKAIVLRNMTAQYGDSRLGYVLGIFLPLVSMGFIFLVFGLRGRIAPPDFPLPVFLVTGFPVWMAFQQTYGRIMGAASKTDALLMFPQINQLDLILATAVLQCATSTIVFVILVVLAAVFTHAPPADFAGVMLLYWAAMWLGMSIGLILSALNRVAPMLVQFMNMFFRVIMWVSGIIYTVDRLPPSFLPYLKWNPLLHVVEGLRQEWVPTYQAPIFSPTFIISTCFVLTMLGLALERSTRRFVGT